MENQIKEEKKAGGGVEGSSFKEYLWDHQEMIMQKL